MSYSRFGLDTAISYGCDADESYDLETWLGETDEDEFFQDVVNEKLIGIAEEEAKKCYNKAVSKIEVAKLLKEQESELDEMEFSSKNELENYVLGEADVVKYYLNSNDLNDDDVDLEELREMQHDLIFMFFD